VALTACKHPRRRHLAVSRSSFAAMAPSVGVVTVLGCPYCKQAKAALTSKGIEYTEAELTNARDILAAVADITGQSTVPQVCLKVTYMTVDSRFEAAAYTLKMDYEPSRRLHSVSVS
jgi:glutaredoxin 3